MAKKAEWIDAAEAREMLGVSKPKMAELLKPKAEGGDGALEWKVNPIDKRGKLIKRSDVEALLRQLPPKKEAA